MLADEAILELQRIGGDAITVMEKSVRENAERMFARVLQERNDPKDQT